MFRGVTRQFVEVLLGVRADLQHCSGFDLLRTQMMDTQKRNQEKIPSRPDGCSAMQMYRSGRECPRNSVRRQQGKDRKNAPLLPAASTCDHALQSFSQTSHALLDSIDLPYACVHTKDNVNKRTEQGGWGVRQNMQRNNHSSWTVQKFELTLEHLALFFFLHINIFALPRLCRGRRLLGRHCCRTCLLLSLIHI